MIDAEVLPLLAELRRVLGRRHCLVGAGETARYRRGFRGRAGSAVAVARPATLVELWRTLKVCVAADVVVILQAANTGLTGGSTPNGRYERPVVIVNTGRLDRLHLMDGARQVVCLPGVSLQALERALGPHDREPHSLLGSTCFGASVVGGICNNSGGSLVRRGPAYTELSLYARLDEDGRLELVNALGLELGTTPEEMLATLEAGAFERKPRGEGGLASDRDYARHVRDVEAPTPARFNNDPRRLHAASGCAGRLAVFAVRTDTFAKAKEEAVFYIGSNDPDELARARRHILARFETLPVLAEYMHRDAFDIAAHYGRDLFWAIRLLGTGRLARMFAAKAALDRFGERLGLRDVGDRALQALGHIMPQHLPQRLRDWRARFEHYLVLKVDQDGAGEARTWLRAAFPTATGDAFECAAGEAKAALLHRFVMAGAAERYRAVHAREVEALVPLDVALPRNATRWLPPAAGPQVRRALHYGHFLCHVFHHDYVLEKGADAAGFKARLLGEFSRRGAEYPAEHNVGHLYAAKPALRAFYRKLDPMNRFNPGVGGTVRAHAWAGDDDTVREGARP